MVAWQKHEFDAKNQIKAKINWVHTWETEELINLRPKETWLSKAHKN